MPTFSFVHQHAVRRNRQGQPQGLRFARIQIAKPGGERCGRGQWHLFQPTASAAQLLDDDSLTALAGTDVTWRVMAGPFNGISASDDGDQRTVTDPAAGGPRKFYTVEIERP